MRRRSYVRLRRLRDWDLGKTLVFFLVGTIVPLCAELLGTGTGWPFGGYSYTDGLGFKILGRVPYSVPLSWFYMGFASYLLAVTISRPWNPRHRAWGAILLGAWLLMAWDLSLDPAMADASMPIRFWNWHETGPYFGMPLRNLAGWFGTGLLFIGLSRAVWRAAPDPKRIPTWLPFGMYAVNVLWAATLSLSASLWLAAAAAIVLGLVPAALALRAARPGRLRGRRRSGLSPWGKGWSDADAGAGEKVDPRRRALHGMAEPGDAD